VDHVIYEPDLAVSPGILGSPFVVSAFPEASWPSTPLNQVNRDPDLAVSPDFTDLPSGLNARVNTFRAFRLSTPVDQIIPAWDAHLPKKSALSDSSSTSSPNTSFNASVAATPSTSFSDTASEYEVKHGQYTILPQSKTKSTCEPGIRLHTTLSASFNLNAIVTPIIKPSSCMQCDALQLPCSQTHPTCTRCTRRHEEPLGGFYGLLRVAEPCLARREQTVDEIEMLPQGLKGTKTKETIIVLFRLESNGDGDWERKLELADELVKGERERLERRNWILPEAPQMVKSGAWDVSDDGV